MQMHLKDKSKNQQPGTESPIQRQIQPSLKSLERSNDQPIAAASQDLIALPLGTKVEHQRFGKGVVTLLEGSGNDKKATIKFNGTGDKKLLLRFAKLKIID